jgi:hypothetical protein
VEDIVYQKAKEEIKSKIGEKYQSVKRGVLSFLGIRNTTRQTIDQISEEIKESHNPILDDQVLGVLELFTGGYYNSLAIVFFTCICLCFQRCFNQYFVVFVQLRTITMLDKKFLST